MAGPRKPPSAWKRLNRWARGAEGQKWTHRAPALLVAATALWISYWHIRHVCLDHGYDVVGASLAPLSVDGLVIVASRYVTHAKTWAGKISAYLGFTAGVAATLFGNLLTADPDLWSQLIATWPAAAVVLTGLILHLGDRKPRPKKKPAQTKAQAAREPQHAEARTRQARARQTNTAEQPALSPA